MNNEVAQYHNAPNFSYNGKFSQMFYPYLQEKREIFHTAN